MGKIHVLDKALAELIAAGEVVERPASIAKELIENAIDSGADKITVEIEGGGISLLRVSDNGCGIAKEDITTAFLRHATSKVNSMEDLAAIRTLGFRGEALASIAAMSRVELTSKTKEMDEGCTYRIEGGEEIDCAPAGCPTGTIITVRDIFYNTPARMKFLKKDVGEGNAVAQVVDKCALSHPEISFRFVRDGKCRLQTSGSGEMLPVIQAIFGRDFAESMIPVKHEILEQGISVRGYVTSPQGAKSTRAYQNFFLNSRYVHTRTASAALEEAFKTAIGAGKFPGCVLHIDIMPELADVNVHPAKLEVRFVNEKPVFHCVYFAVKSMLTATYNGTRPFSQAPQENARPSAMETRQVKLSEPPHRAQPQARMTSREFRSLFAPEESDDDKNRFFKSQTLNASKPDIFVGPDEGNPSHPQKLESVTFYDDFFTSASDMVTVSNAGILEKNATSIKNPAESEHSPQKMHTCSEPYRLIGELAGTYILLEQEGDLILVDKHAAHERILYEKIKASVAYGNRQVLLSPISLTLAGEEYDLLTTHLDRLLSLGFLVEDFGGNTVLVREIPIELGERDIAFILGDIAAKLSEGKRDITPDALDRLYFSIACKSAVRARDKNAVPELAAIVDKLGENPEITHCPHGRPVQVSFTARDIEKRFGRLG